MKLGFSIQKKINLFTIQNEISRTDLEVIRQSVMRFFNSNPLHVVLDLSQSNLQIPEEELQSALIELKTYAQAKNISFIIAQTDIESMRAPNQVIEIALQKKLSLLESKIQLREEMRSKAMTLVQENEDLRSLLQKDKPSTSRAGSIVERLWSNR